MTQFLIGTGGWSYFKTKNKSNLEAYSQIFNFVEVNCTFYQYQPISQVESWRQMVPSDFVFSVRCHQDLTHKIGLKPTDEAFEVFNKMNAYCKALKTPYLVIQTPATQKLDTVGVKDSKDFFSSLSLDGLRLVWEYRAPLTVEVAELMADFNIIQSVDLSVNSPILSQDVAYSRLFGKGNHNIYQFSDDELLEIRINAKDTKAEKVILAYHGSRMYSDAARFKMHNLTGKFMQVTDYFGIDSAKAVLAEDSQFPLSKKQLITDQGWKVFDLTVDRHVHLSEVLEWIPEKIYTNIEEVTAELRMFFE